MIVADSHEFIELYRGDKDYRLGAEMIKLRDDVRFVSFAPDSLSPNEQALFGESKVAAAPVSIQLPPGMELRLIPSIGLRFAKKEGGGIVALTWGYGRHLRRLRPDVILETPYSWLTPRSYVTFAVSRRYGIPVVYYDPGEDVPILLRHQVMAAWESPVVNHASAIITYNEAGRRRFVRKYGYPSDRIHVIPKPIDVQRLTSGGEARARVRQSWGVGQDQMVIAYLGRLTRIRGSSVLLDVARAALADSDLACCLFVFIGDTMASRESGADYLLPNTRITGMLPNRDIPAVLAGVDVVVFPDVTSPGAFPTAVAEAMGAGKAIIAGVGDRTDFLPLADGESGLIVPPRDVSAILHAVRTLSSNTDLRESLGRRVRYYAAAQMDYPVVAGKYLDILERAIEETRSRRGTS